MNDTSAAPAAPSDLLNGGAAPPPTAPAPAAAPAWQPAGMPVTPAAFDAPEAVAARAEIKSKISDKEFYKALVAERERGITGPASQAWSGLHAKGYPAATAVTSQADVDNQAAGRNAQAWDGYIQALKQRTDLSEAQIAEIRSGVVNETAYAWAREEKDRLIKDRSFRTKLLDGDRQANRDWTLVTSILSLRPVRK